MSIAIRLADPEADRAELLFLLQENLPALPHARRYDWLYRNNPDGPARSWFAVDQDTRRAVGVTSVFPRAVWVNGRADLCGQVGDFAISAAYRSLGPAVLIQRATFQPVDEGKLCFSYDCPPHEAGMSTFRRIGLEPNCALHRYALPLRLDEHLRKRLGFSSPPLAAVGNGLWRLWRGGGRIPKGLEIAVHSGRFSEEFTHFDELLPVTGTVRGRRAAAQLNWRYLDDPLNTYAVLTARRGGELLGFVVFQQLERKIIIVDLAARNLASVAIALLDTVTRQYGSSCDTVDACISSDSDLAAPLLQAGFRARSVVAQVVAYASPRTEMSVFLKTDAHWDFNCSELRA